MKDAEMEIADEIERLRDDDDRHSAVGGGGFDFVGECRFGFVERR